MRVAFKGNLRRTVPQLTLHNERSLARGRNAKAIWQDLVSEQGFTGGYQAVKRYVRKLRGPKQPEAAGIILTSPGEEAQVGYGSGPMVRDPQSGKYRRTRLFVLTLGYSRKSVRLLTWRSSARTWAELHEQAFSPFRRLDPSRGSGQLERRRGCSRHPRPHPEPAVSRCPGDKEQFSWLRLSRSPAEFAVLAGCSRLRFGLPTAEIPHDFGKGFLIHAATINLTVRFVKYTLGDGTLVSNQKGVLLMGGTHSDPPLG